jgi:hypothetical protein
LDLERVQSHRQHHVVTSEKAELDQFDLVELPGQPLPELRPNPIVLAELIDSGKDQRLPG